MKQGRANKHKNCGKNEEEEQCRNLARAVSAKWYGMPVPSGMPMSNPISALLLCKIPKTWHDLPAPHGTAILNLLHRDLFKVLPLVVQESNF